MPRNNGQTILVVDDEPQVVDLVRHMLAKEGYNALEARSAEEALHVAAQFQQEIHLLLTDIVMPELNGRELADRLKASRPDLKVVYMSGYMDAAIRDLTGLTFAGVPLLRKPFTQFKLISQIRELLGEPPEELERPAPDPEPKESPERERGGWKQRFNLLDLF